jgi:signal transduction histidine kinase
LFNQAQQASRARDELLAIVAHDLRNPLSTVKMGSGLLRDTATTDVQRRYAELVTKAADRMHRLIEDLLDVTRIESGKLRVELRPFPVASLINEAVAMLTPLASSRNISLSANTECQTEPVMLDSTRIMQVFSNLVGNALKFTPEGGQVRIGCDLIPGELRVSVSDTGPGIPRDQIPHIFGRLWQASDHDMRGIGLGLSIVRGIVEAHGGRVWVESEEGQGTSFYFTLRFPPTETSETPVRLEQAVGS